MFWDTFKSLCERNGKTPNGVCKELKFSTATATHWKNGKVPGGTSLEKLAIFFDVPVGYLLNESEDEKTKTPRNEKSLSDMQAKLLATANDLSDEGLEQAIEMIELLKLKYKK